MAKAQVLYFMPVILSTLLPGSDADVNYGGVRSGNATYYLEADGRGSCLFDAMPEPQYVGALNNSDYFSPEVNGKTFPGATLCGAYARVKGNRGEIVIKIVDRCPDDICTKGHIDLSLEAFSAIDDPVKGYVPITWELISRPTQGSVSFRYKDGSSQWWSGIQVRNHRNPVATLEVRQGSTWRELPRTEYNYFLAEDGLGEGYHTYRITDIFGNQLIEKSTAYLGDYQPDSVDWQGKGQFPAP